MASRIIKKYPNRRLYDTESSRYVNLKDIKKLIQKYQSICIIDTATNQDITRAILLQVIVEEELNAPLFTTHILEMLIKIYGDSTSALMSRFMEHSLQEFINHQGKLKNPVSSINSETKKTTSPVMNLAKNNLDKWHKKSNS